MSSSRIRVVIQNGEYWLCNKGDLAMLDVTLARLRARWADARIGVMTSAPLLLAAYAPTAEPILHPGPGRWMPPGRLSRLAAFAGPRAAGPPSIAWLQAREVRARQLQRVRRVARFVAGGRTSAPVVREPRGAHRAAVRDASLVLAMGGGYMTDVDLPQAHRTLDLLEEAIAHEIPTAMVGQGFGPIDDPALIDRAAEILPRVDMIALREDRQGPGLLARLGVSSSRVLVTGDDAIQLAYDLRREEFGTGIGVCLRVAAYSPVAVQAREAVGGAVRAAAAQRNASVIPLIVSEYHSEDRRTTLPLVAPDSRAVRPLGSYATARELAARVSDCRILVTGAYHLAVFALSQGIPVVGLSSSRYYDGKIRGLESMFGGGLKLVRLDSTNLDRELRGAIDQAWQDAPAVRARLRQHARDQIAMGREGYSRIFSLVESRITRAGELRTQ